MTAYNKLIERVPMPPRIAKLPVSEQGYPIPWFVPWDGDKPFTQASDPRKLRMAIQHDLCWCCGERLGGYKAFILGPMCVVNRITSEPPSHRDCAEYALQTCPFLINPRMRRNPVDDDRKQNPGGVFIERNPGVAALWMTRGYRRFTPRGGGVLISVGDPTDVAWYREGRVATRAEILASLESGFPILREAAEKEEATGLQHSVEAVEVAYQAAMRWIPAV